MSYIDNPYNSDVGKALLKKNLTNIFLVGEKPNSLESANPKKQWFQTLGNKPIQ